MSFPAPAPVTIKAGIFCMMNLADFERERAALITAGLGGMHNLVSQVLEGCHVPLIAKELLSVLDTRGICFSQGMSPPSAALSAGVVCPGGSVKVTVPLDHKHVELPSGESLVRSLEFGATDISEELRSHTSILATDKLRIVHHVVTDTGVSSLRLFAYRSGAFSLWIPGMKLGTFTEQELACTGLHTFRWIRSTPGVMHSGSMYRSAHDGGSVLMGFQLVASPFSWDLDTLGRKDTANPRSAEDDAYVLELEDVRRRVGLSLADVCRLVGLIQRQPHSPGSMHTVAAESDAVEEAMKGLRVPAAATTTEKK